MSGDNFLAQGSGVVYGALIQDLDVVRVSPERYLDQVAIRSNTIRAVRTAKLAIAIYRRLNLHPWQAFAHPLFRDSSALADLLTGAQSPVLFHWRSESPTFCGALV